MERRPFTAPSRTLACAAALLFGATALRAQPAAPEAPTVQGPLPAPTVLPAVQVKGHYDNDIGTSDAASEGAVTQRLIKNRPALRPGEILEFVPGMIVTQHSGDGKAAAPPPVSHPTARSGSTLFPALPPAAGPNSACAR